MSPPRPPSRFAALLLAGTLLAACHRAPPTELVAGAYRAVATVPGGELPFGFTVAIPEGKPPVVYLVNGAGAVHVTETAHDGDRLVLRLPGYASRLELVADPTGYHGEAVMFPGEGHEARLPLRIVRGERHRFASSGPKIPPKVGGRWAITFTGRDGSAHAAVGEFKQLGSRLFGTILDVRGDHRFLEGDVTESEVLLSAFDGGTASLYRAKINADGSLSGRWWAGSWATEDFVARPDAAAALPVAAANPPATTPLAFSFPDLEGKPVSLADPRFHGKVVVLALGGSWNANSHDQAEFLATLAKQFRSEGLEILSLQFEPFAERSAAVAANRRFVAATGIDWPVLIVGPADRAAASKALPAIGELASFPSTVLVGRDGRMRRVEAGFSGPATGMHYDEYRKSFTDALRALLAEKP